jgi:hypothetical protein
MKISTTVQLNLVIANLKALTALLEVAHDARELHGNTLQLAANNLKVIYIIVEEEYYGARAYRDDLAVQPLPKNKPMEEANAIAVADMRVALQDVTDIIAIKRQLADILLEYDIKLSGIPDIVARTV